MIRLVQLGNNSESIIEPQALVTKNLANMWLELVDPTEDEIKAVSDASALPASFLRLPQQGMVNLRLEMGFGVIEFVVMKDVVETKENYPVILAFCKDFLVTVAPKDIEGIINTAKERMSKSRVDPPSQVIYYILDEIVASHFEHLEVLEHLTSEIEEEVVEKTTPETLKKIFSLKSNMISFNKTLWYQRSLIFNLHKCGDNCMAAKARDLFLTTHEDLTRQIDIVETYREILSDAINVHLSATSNKINLSINALTIVIFYLTIVTTVTSFPNTIATFFGIAQFGNTNVYIIATLLLASLILPIIWLWRRKWLNVKTALRQASD
jgi:Mg2+ and Co2+ transporter CorA